MIESAWLGELEIHRSGALAISEWRSAVAPRVSRSVRPREHGAIDRTRLKDGRRFDLRGYARGNSPLEAQDAVDELAGVLGNGPVALLWTPEGADYDVTAQVVLDSEIEAPLRGTSKRIEWGMSLFAADPRMYSAYVQVLEQRPIPPSTFADLTPTNGGNFPTPPVIRIYGPLGPGPGTFLEINNITTGQTFRLTNPALLVNEVFIVDMAARTVTIDSTGAGGGVSLLPSLVNPSQSEWWALAPGQNALGLEGAVLDGDTGWGVTWRDART